MGEAPSFKYMRDNNCANVLARIARMLLLLACAPLTDKSANIYEFVFVRLCLQRFRFAARMG